MPPSQPAAYRVRTVPRRPVADSTSVTVTPSSSCTADVVSQPRSTVTLGKSPSRSASSGSRKICEIRCCGSGVGHSANSTAVPSSTAALEENSNLVSS